MKMFSSCCELRNNWIRLLLNDPGGWAGTRFQHIKWRFSYAGKTVNAASMEHMTEHIIYVNVRSRIMTYTIISPHVLLFIHIFQRWCFFILRSNMVLLYISVSLQSKLLQEIIFQIYHHRSSIFFVPPGAETHTRLDSHLSLSLCHTCENLFHFHTRAALFSVFLHSDVLLETPTGSEDRVLGFVYLFSFAFLPVYSRNSALLPLFWAIINDLY